MRQYIFIFFGFACWLQMASVIGQISRSDQTAYCFKFTWIGQNSSASQNFTCKKLKNVPCVTPIHVTDDILPPNTTWMWEYLTHSDITCPLTSACIKYSYSFDNKVINTTYFCGKMIEDGFTSIQNGCYTQSVNGHIIEACACQSYAGAMPCNSSTKKKYSTLLTLLLITVCIIYKTFIYT